MTQPPSPAGVNAPAHGQPDRRVVGRIEHPIGEDVARLRQPPRVEGLESLVDEPPQLLAAARPVVADGLAAEVGLLVGGGSAWPAMGHGGQPALAVRTAVGGIDPVRPAPPGRGEQERHAGRPPGASRDHRTSATPSRSRRRAGRRRRRSGRPRRGRRRGDRKPGAGPGRARGAAPEPRAAYMPVTWYPASTIRTSPVTARLRGPSRNTAASATLRALGGPAQRRALAIVLVDVGEAGDAGTPPAS